jgi:ribosomal-protein-alanine N-acetyltransferase
MHSAPPRTPFPELETDRLILREIHPGDAGDLYRIFSDADTMEFWSCRPYSSLQQAIGLIERMAEARRTGSALHWGISLKGDPRLIGKCGFNEWRTVHRRGDVSYILSRDFWGKGIVTEALSRILDFGFDQMNLHSIEAGVTPGNVASTKMLEKLGFRLEGHLHESFWAEDRFVDSLIFSLLAKEWKQRRIPRRGAAEPDV